MRGVGRLLIISGLIALSLQFAVGCREKEAIPHATMERVIEEIFLVNGTLVVVDSLHKSLQVGTLEPYEPIMHRHGVTREEFDTALMELLSKPAEFDAMLDRVIANLQVERTRLESEEASDLKELDTTSIELL